MRLVTKEGIERLLLANPIAEVAAEHGIELSPLGGGLLVGRCPLHEAHSGRSLLVFPASGLFRCLVCCGRGDVLGLLVRLEGVSVLGALEQLASRARLDLDALMRTSPRRPRAPRSSEVPEWALTPPPELGGPARGGR